MTTTTELIDRLAAELKPVRQGAVLRRLALGIGGGMLLSAALMLAWLGLRPDLGAAAGTMPFWAKSVYTLLLAIVGLAATERVAKPAGEARRATIAAIIIVALVAVLAIAQLSSNPASMAPALIMGSSATRCPWYIVVLSLPILAGAVWALRGLAPTNLRLAGAVSGLMAGAAGAWIYSFHCDEVAMPFLAIWYTGGIVIVGAIGSLFADRLRW